MMAIHSGGQVYEKAQEWLADLRDHVSFLERIGYATWYPARRRVGDARREVTYAYQRVVRGWDDSAVWSLDHHLAKTLGQQLMTMAEIAHGFPTDYGDTHFTPDNPTDHPRFAQWVTDLKTHGDALLAYHHQGYELDGADWEAIYRPAQEALRWVAEHFADLWD